VKPRVYVITFGGTFWIGIILLVLGVLWTLDNLRLVDSEPILRWWPLALVAFGVAKLTGAGGPARPVFGTMLVGAGGLLLLNQFGVIDFGIAELWAIGLIFIGGLIVYRSMYGRRMRSVHGDTSDRMNVAAIIAGVERKVQSTAFRGGEVAAVMGGVELNFGAARLEGNEASLELLAIMGGIELYVPPDWQVSIEVTPVMGAVEDQRSSPPVEGAQHLRLTGFVLMGGVEIKDLPETR